MEIPWLSQWANQQGFPELSGFPKSLATQAIYYPMSPGHHHRVYSPLSLISELTNNMTADSSTPSHAELSGVMVIDTITTSPGKPKTLYITSAFYNVVKLMMGVFKYFNKYDYIIELESRWFVNATVRFCHVSLFPMAEQDFRLLYSMQQLFQRWGLQSILKTTLTSWETSSM